MQLRVVHLMAFFIFVYVGVEGKLKSHSSMPGNTDQHTTVTIGGWIVTFVIQKRGGGAKAGYVSSGFFGGS